MVSEPEPPTKPSGLDILRLISESDEILTLGIGIPGCVACSQMQRTLEELVNSGDAPGHVVWHVASFETSSSIQLLKHVELREFPTLYVFHRGQLLGGFVGFKEHESGLQQTAAGLLSELSPLWAFGVNDPPPTRSQVDD